MWNVCEIIVSVSEKAKVLTKKALESAGTSEIKAFYWEKRKEKREGECYCPVFVILFNFSDNR